MNRLKVLTLALATTLLAPVAVSASTLPVKIWGEGLSLERGQKIVRSVNDIFALNGADVRLTLGGVGPESSCDKLWNKSGINVVFTADLISASELGRAPVNSLPMGKGSGFCVELLKEFIRADAPDYYETYLVLTWVHEVGHTLSLEHVEGTVMSEHLEGHKNFEAWQVTILNEAARQASTNPEVKAASGGLLLGGGRFTVDATWRTGEGKGFGRPQALTTDTGYFWFFDPTNLEVVVKVLDGCGVNNRFWVFASGLTNVEVTLTVTDTKTGVSKTYTNPQGRAFLPIQDTSAFATCE